MSETLHNLKDSLRKAMLDRRAALTAGEVRAASAAIWERLAQVESFGAAESVCAYVSHANEVETHGLIRQLLAMGREVSVPLFVEGRYVRAVIEDFDADLQVGHWGILEPRVVRAGREPAAWLVPGVVFDERAHRLGHGKGYFDRLLAGVPGVKIGLAYEFQVVETVPVAAHDVRLDFIITENKTIKGI